MAKIVLTMKETYKVAENLKSMGESDLLVLNRSLFGKKLKIEIVNIQKPEVKSPLPDSQQKPN